MSNINLISARRAERVRTRKVGRSLVTAMIASGAVGLGLFVFVTGQIVVTNSQIAQAEGELEKLKPVLAAIEADERDRAELQPKLTTLSMAQARTQHWFGVLEGLKQAIPGQTWLTGLGVEGTEEAKLLRLTGVTANQTRVGETMYRLNLQPQYYAKVDLRYTQALQGGQRNAVEFELAAQMAPLAVVDAKTGETNAPAAK
jgi:Tfp pilus assembly protein PilN